MIIRKIVQEAKPLIKIIRKEAGEVATSSMRIVPKAQAPKPKMTIKPSIAQTTFEEGVGTNIIAEQNRARITIRPKEQTNNTTHQMKIVPQYNQDSSHNFNINNRTLEELKDECKIFKDLTGAELHVPSSGACYGGFSGAVSLLGLCGKQGNFPNDIKHVLVGHGMGSARGGDWSIINGGGNILNYIGNNSSIKKGQKVLVLCCEEGEKIEGMHAVGGHVELGLFNPKEPAKIVVKGDNNIAGEFYFPRFISEESTVPFIRMYEPTFKITKK